MHILSLAAGVALSLSNAVDYISFPAHSNLLQGVGMGAGAAYLVPRGEDMDFLQEAIRERIAACRSRGATYSMAYNYRLPFSRDVKVEYSFISNCYAATFSSELPPAAGGSETTIYGFVPASLGIGEVTVPIHGLNPEGWLLPNGLDPSQNVKALLTDQSELFNPRDIPRGFDFSRLLSLAEITNAYAWIDGPMCEALLASALPPDSPQYNLTTNVDVDVYSYGQVSNYTYTAYSLDGSQRRYPSGYALYPWPRETTTVTNADVVGRDMTCRRVRSVSYVTPIGLEYTSATTCVFHVLSPYIQSDIQVDSLPGKGARWMFPVEIYLSYSEKTGGFVYEDDLTVTNASIVCLWTFKEREERRWSRISWAPLMPTNTVTETVRHAVSCWALGELERIPGSRNWIATGVNQGGFGTGVSDIQSDAVDEFGSYWGWRSMSLDPGKVLPEHIPAEGSVQPGLGNMFEATCTTTLTKEITAAKVYFLLIVKPKWRARVASGL